MRVIRIVFHWGWQAAVCMVPGGGLIIAWHNRDKIRQAWQNREKLLVQAREAASAMFLRLKI